MSGEDWPDIEGALKDYLKADVDVLATAAGSRTYLALPDKPTFPCITIIRISGGETASEVPLEQALVQIDVRGRVQQLAETEAVRKAVRKALSKLQGRPFDAAGKARLYAATVADDRRFPEPRQQDEDGAIGERPRFILTAQVVGAFTS